MLPGSLPVTTTPLPHATGAYGQLPGRDFTPLDLLLLLRTDRPRFFHSAPENGGLSPSVPTYANFAGCGREGSGFQDYLLFAERSARKARGVLLSASDPSDQIVGSCKPALDSMTNATVRERVLDVGGGHELFYAPKADWLDVLQAWAERRDQ